MSNLEVKYKQVHIFDATGVVRNERKEDEK